MYSLAVIYLQFWSTGSTWRLHSSPIILAECQVHLGMCILAGNQSQSEADEDYNESCTHADKHGMYLYYVHIYPHKCTWASCMLQFHINISMILQPTRNDSLRLWVLACILHVVLFVIIFKDIRAFIKSLITIDISLVIWSTLLSSLCAGEHALYPCGAGQRSRIDALQRPPRPIWTSAHRGTIPTSEKKRDCLPSEVTGIFPRRNLATGIDFPPGYVIFWTIKDLEPS